MPAHAQDQQPRDLEAGGEHRGGGDLHGLAQRAESRPAEEHGREAEEQDRDHRAEEIGRADVFPAAEDQQRPVRRKPAEQAARRHDRHEDQQHAPDLPDVLRPDHHVAMQIRLYHDL